ncbi:hypothetical protein OG558_28960 [Kribbella sp. NBC_01510]|uniref:hypothetical protein n=1 Tax=Kribbella sp. NBC_01510 TaxID=2903581 RepID=UPI0038645838
MGRRDLDLGDHRNGGGKPARVHLSEPDAAGPAAAGWEAGLVVVEAQLEGTPITWNPLDRAEDLARRT